MTGDNGSGKSTLLNVLAGTLEAASGQAIVGARRVGRLAQDVVFRDPGLTPNQAYAAATSSTVVAG